MKILIIVAASVLMAATSCQSKPKPPPVVFDPTAPRFPEEIKNFYVMDASEAPVSNSEEFKAQVINPQDLPTFSFYTDDIQYACLKFDIVSGEPFLLKYIEVAPWPDCNGVGGYRPADHQKFYNFLSDLSQWAWHREKK